MWSADLARTGFSLFPRHEGLHGSFALVFPGTWLFVDSFSFYYSILLVKSLKITRLHSTRLLSGMCFDEFSNLFSGWISPHSVGHLARQLVSGEDKVDEAVKSFWRSYLPCQLFCRQLMPKFAEAENYRSCFFLVGFINFYSPLWLSQPYTEVAGWVLTLSRFC